VIAIGGTGFEVEALVPLLGRVVFGVHQQGANASNVSSGNGTAQCVFQECRSKAMALVLLVDRQAGQEHDGHWMMCQALADTLWRVCMGDAANDQAVISRYVCVVAADVSLGAVGPLAVECVALQKLIECGLPAVERVHCIGWCEFADSLKHAPSAQQAWLGHELLQTWQGLRWRVQRLLKLLPLRVTEDKVIAIGQGKVCGGNAGIEQKFADVFVTGTCGLL